jgi:hypothetical protein
MLSLGQVWGMLGIVSTELAVKPRTPNGHQLLGDWNPKDV